MWDLYRSFLLKYRPRVGFCIHLAITALFIMPKWIIPWLCHLMWHAISAYAHIFYACNTLSPVHLTTSSAIFSDASSGNVDMPVGGQNSVSLYLSLSLSLSSCVLPHGHYCGRLLIRNCLPQALQYNRL